MKKIAGISLIGFALLNSFASLAQSYTESALLFSRAGIGGSARVQALGGAQVSLGGDFSSAYSNPAGLGMYNRSEFTITPGFTSSNATSSYYGSSTSASQSKLILPGISFVLHTEKERFDGSIRRGSFGVSINRFNDFNRSLSYKGTNPYNTIADYFGADASTTANANSATQEQLFGNNGYLNGTPTQLAWDTWFINQVIPGNYQYAADSTGALSSLNFYGTPLQKENIKTKGSQYQVNLSYGLNVDDKLFLGAGLGITSLDYTSSKSYSEVYTGGLGYLRSMGLTEYLHTSGSGINLTLGAIYRPVNFMQFGFSFATPTLYNLFDSYSATMTTDWAKMIHKGKTTPETIQSYFDPYSTSYGLNTPLRASGGLTFFIKKLGFISGDIEYVNYGKAKYVAQVTSQGSLSSDYISQVNGEIVDSYRSAFNYRFGGEYRIKKYRARLGYSYMSDPYKVAQETKASIQSYSVGVGYRSTKFFVDVTAILKQSSGAYYPYTDAGTVIVQQNVTTIMTTLGFPF